MTVRSFSEWMDLFREGAVSFQAEWTDSIGEAVDSVPLDAERRAQLADIRMREINWN